MLLIILANLTYSVQEKSITLFKYRLLIRMQQFITYTGLPCRTVLKSTYTCYITCNPY